MVELCFEDCCFHPGPGGTMCDSGTVHVLQPRLHGKYPTPLLLKFAGVMDERKSESQMFLS